MINNLQKIIREKNMQFEKTNDNSKDNTETEKEPVLLLIQAVQESNKKLHDMICAIADNQKLLYANMMKIMKKLEIDENI